jgi:hypothetical protein
MPLVQKSVYEDCYTLVLPRFYHLNINNLKIFRPAVDESFILSSSDYSPHYFDAIISLFRDAEFEQIISQKSIQTQIIYKLVEQNISIAIVPHFPQYGLIFILNFWIFLR